MSIINIQQKLKAKKGQRNAFGNYNYRSAEDILESVKPLLAEAEMYLTISDSLEYIGDRYYIKGYRCREDQLTIILSQKLQATRERLTAERVWMLAKSLGLPLVTPGSTLSTVCSLSMMARMQTRETIQRKIQQKLRSLGLQR